jgi:hypothetical protein
VWKLALFRARFAGVSSTLTDVTEHGDTVVAVWTTRFPDGELTQWRGTFAIAGEAITRFEVEHVA